MLEIPTKNNLAAAKTHAGGWREGAKIRKAKYLTQLFTKWSIFVCNCEAVTCYLFYNGRVARGPDPTKKITHVPETFRAEQSRGAICFAFP